MGELLLVVNDWCLCSEGEGGGGQFLQGSEEGKTLAVHSLCVELCSILCVESGQEPREKAPATLSCKHRLDRWNF